MPLPQDENTNLLQVFTPNPAFATTKTIADNTSVTWTIPAGVRAYTFSPTVTVERRLGSVNHGSKFAANPDTPYGPYGVYPGMTQVVFAGLNGTIEIEAM